jgi:hypothetical protein
MKSTPRSLAIALATVAWLVAGIDDAPLARARSAEGSGPPTSVTVYAQAAPAATPEAAVPASGGLGANDVALLERSPYVYISSTRKDGSLSTPAEIWFMWSDGAVWVATPPTSWRAKRIRWGRPMAKIWIGTRDGPSFRAKGEIVNDPKRYDQLFAAFAAKYPDRWSRWEKSFREGLASGERVLIRYTPSPG